MKRRVTRRRALGGLAAMIVLPVVSGCSAGAGAGGVGASADDVVGMTYRTLVLPPPKLATHWDIAPYEDAWDWGWENYRNDDALGIGGSSGLVQSQEIEVRGRDRRSVNNGRVTESSHTTTRTLRRGFLFTP